MSTTTVDFEAMVNDFKRSSYNEYNALIVAIIEQMGDNETFVQWVDDMGTYGMSQGIPNFTYTREMRPFVLKNHKEILNFYEAKAKQADVSVLYFIENVNWVKKHNITRSEMEYLLYNPKDDEHQMYAVFYNSLVYYLTEEVCRTFVSWSESVNIRLREEIYGDYEIESLDDD